MTSQDWFAGIVVLGSVALAGCQTTGVTQKLHTEMYPPIELATSAEIGETALERTHGIGSPGFKVEDLEFEQGGYRFFLPGDHYQIGYESPEGESIAYGYGNLKPINEGVTIAGANYQLVAGQADSGCSLQISNLNLMNEDGKLITNWVSNGQREQPQETAISIGGRTILSGSILGGSQVIFTVKIPEDQCAKRYKFVDYGQTFRQELIYLGRSGDELSFKYREFSGSLARPAFSADLKYDLSESQTIGYRGARIEVIEAGNQIIQYRVKSHMKGI
jgi:hypothetical protein